VEFLASLFVGKPLNILAVAAFWFVSYLIIFVGIAKVKAAWTLLVTSLAWLAYAAWEWLILIKTPEANIRVDLLMLWPILTILTLFTIYKVFRNFPMLRHR
jgi:hypothetical protein